MSPACCNTSRGRRSGGSWGNTSRNHCSEVGVCGGAGGRRAGQRGAGHGEGERALAVDWGVPVGGEPSVSAAVPARSQPHLERGRALRVDRHVHARRHAARGIERPALAACVTEASAATCRESARASSGHPPTQQGPLACQQSVPRRRGRRVHVPAGAAACRARHQPPPVLAPRAQAGKQIMSKDVRRLVALQQLGRGVPERSAGAPRRGAGSCLLRRGTNPTASVEPAPSSRVENVERLLVGLLGCVRKVVGQAHAGAACGSEAAARCDTGVRRARARARQARWAGRRGSPPVRNGLDTLKWRRPSCFTRLSGCHASRLPPVQGGEASSSGRLGIATTAWGGVCRQGSWAERPLCRSAAPAHVAASPPNRAGCWGPSNRASNSSGVMPLASGTYGIRAGPAPSVASPASAGVRPSCAAARPPPGAPGRKAERSTWQRYQRLRAAAF